MNAKVKRADILLYDPSTVQPAADLTAFGARLVRLLGMLFRGGRGIHFDDITMDAEQTRPPWLFIEGPRSKPGAQAMCMEPAYRAAPNERPCWAYADRPVIVSHWDSYFRMPHWPEGVFRLGTNPPEPLLEVVGDNFICPKQDVYYHEAKILAFDDPFEFLK